MPLYFVFVLLFFNIGIYFTDRRAGIIFSVFLLVYAVYVFTVYMLNRPALTKEILNFATQYSSVQRKILDNFKAPQAILDMNGKIIWVNKQFEAVTGKSKNYHKTIFSIFPMISKERLQSEKEAEFLIEWEDKFFRGEISRISFQKGLNEGSILDVEEEGQNFIFFCLFDETKLNHYIKAFQEQKLVAALIYIDNYEEALDSIEEVKR